MKKAESTTGNGEFSSRATFKRALDKARGSLPSSPLKKAKVIQTLMSSPTTKKLLTPSTKPEDATAQAMVQDLKDTLSEVKSKRSDDARAAMNVGISLLCGQNVAATTSKTKIASTLGINRRRISQCLQHRYSAMSKGTGWTALQRKTRKDATPEEVRRAAYDFWHSPGISRPTGNKRDVARDRIGPKEYVHHEKYILEKTQTEVYEAFKKKYPDFKIGQRYVIS